MELTKSQAEQQLKFLYDTRKGLHQTKAAYESLIRDLERDIKTVNENIGTIENAMGMEGK